MQLESFPHGLKPNRRLGQHFLVDRDLQKKLVRYASLKKDDVVLEVGPGDGAITSMMAEITGKVIAIEKDPRLVELLRRRFNALRTVEIIEGDVLRQRLPDFNKIVSNIPYYISSKFMLLLTKKTFELAILTLQKEFAQKLMAKNGTPGYRRVTVAVQQKMTVDMLDPVPRQSFYPIPKVDSVIVVLKPRQNPHWLSDQSLFDELVRELFTQRRKRVEKVLTHYLKSKMRGLDRDLVRELKPPNSRVYEMTVKEFEELSNGLSSALKERIQFQSSCKDN